MLTKKPLFLNRGRTDRVLCKPLFDPQSEEAKAKTMSRHYRTARPASSQPDHHERTSTSALTYARIVPD